MGVYEAATYGDQIAGVYDQWYGACEDGMIETLAGLAGGGPALELGIGTGRVALPLVECGVAVHGIDASEQMVAKLRDKPGGAAIPVTLGDFGSARADGSFRLVYVVFNTFFGLLTQEEQLTCFRNVAAHLSEDGVFLMEAFVPDPCRFNRGQNVQALSAEPGEVHLTVSTHDAVSQRSTSQHVRLTEHGIRMYPVQIRYAWPAELDLMARLAGLQLRHRWGGWRSEPFTAASQKHVTVWERS